MRVIENLENYTDYLKDESLLTGHADQLVFCHNNDEVEQVIKNCYKETIPMTIQGALTGICGGAVPHSGTIINLSEMNTLIGMTYNERDDYFTIKTQAGVLLKDLNAAILSQNIDCSKWDNDSLKAYGNFTESTAKMFPTDPTETLASIGGMVACDASGATSFAYGSVRQYVESICLITPLKKLTIRRGQYKYADIREVFGLEIDSLPSWQEHRDQLKDVVGLFYQEAMDLIDLFIGGEGILGVITEVELKLLDAHPITFGIMVFLNQENKLVEFVNWLRKALLPKPCAIEYFDHHTFQLVNQFRQDKGEIKALPMLSKDYDGGIYLEFHLETDEELESVMDQLWHGMGTYGVNEEEQWLGLEPSDFMKLKRFRHAVPECVNILVTQKKLKDDRLHKIGTDMAVLDDDLGLILETYKRGLQKEDLEGILFGHIGNNHLHVNIIPDSFSQYEAAKELVLKWAKLVVDLKGTVAAEHGIGRLKKPLSNHMLSKQDFIEMKRIKSLLEPKGLMNSDVLMD